MGGAVVLAGVIAALVGSDAPAASAWVIVGVVALFLVTTAVSLVNLTWGVTLLTPTAMVLTSPGRRRTVPWDRVTRIEVLRRNGRWGRTWIVARIHLTDGPPVQLPGLLQGAAGQPKAEFQERVGVLLDSWQQATGRTEAVLVNL